MLRVACIFSAIYHHPGLGLMPCHRVFYAGDSFTPLKERGFEVIPSERAEDGVLLRSLKNGKLVRLVPPELEPGWVFIADGKIHKHEIYWVPKWIKRYPTSLHTVDLF